MQKNVINSWVDYIAIISMVFVCIGYCLFGASFAQIRLQPHCFNFPIFIGEILLFFCTLLFIVKNIVSGWQLGRWGWVIGAYLAFVLYKAFIGYVHWGPLAFRDAALFYYPLFIIFGFSFWSNDLFGDRARWLLMLGILSIFVFHKFIPFCTCTLIILAAIMVLKAKSFWDKVIGSVLIIILLPYDTLFDVLLRTILLASMVTGLFIGIIVFLWFCKDRKLRIFGSIMGLLILLMFSSKFYHTAVGKTFSIATARPAAPLDDRQPQPSQMLFHPVGSTNNKPDTVKEFFQNIDTKKICPANKAVEKHQQCSKVIVQKCRTVPVTSAPSINRISTTCNKDMLGIKEGDTLFRYYIWRDMFFEFARHKPVFGFNFGRPLRSPTIEHYKIPYPASVDGWVGAHNSFLYIIYRAGIIGVVFVLALLFVWFKLVRDFYVLRDPVGIGLCAILLNWFVSTNFFLILELPYTAIPVWMILGITLKHRAQLKNSLV